MVVIPSLFSSSGHRHRWWPARDQANDSVNQCSGSKITQGNCETGKLRTASASSSCDICRYQQNLRGCFNYVRRWHGSALTVPKPSTHGSFEAVQALSLRRNSGSGQTRRLRHGADLGLIPIVIEDACGHGHKDAAERSMENIFFMGNAFVTNVQELRETLGLMTRG
jgi:hypothetical protein